ncbi:MAG: HAMP domain-containing protein, partial [bacterium]
MDSLDGAPRSTVAGATSLRRSFAFRLVVAFAVVALVGAGATALVVNAAFAARFDRYLQQQQTAQLDRISSGIARAYAGNERWDRQALEAVLPNVGSGDVRVIGTSGQDVWGWDGHSMSWDDHWMQGGSDHDSRDGSSQPSQGGQAGWNDIDHAGDRSGSDHGSGSENWGSGSWSDEGWSQTSAVGSSRPLALLAFDRSTPSANPDLTSADLGTVQRIPILVDGKVVGTAIVRLPTATALPDAIAFRSEVIRLLLLGGALGALLSFALGIFFARRTTRPVREVTGAARALASGDRSVRLEAERPDEFGEMGRAFNSMADAIDDEEQLRQGFAGEVAHELRTPLTILRTQVEGFRVGVLQPTPE